MNNVCRSLWRLAPLAALIGVAFAAAPARAQTITFPQWMLDSFTLENRYLVLWEYWKGGQETRFNVWTQLGDPLNPGDDFRYFVTIDTSGNETIVWPWGSRLLSGQRPTQRIGTTGDDRPYANVVTLHVEDPTNTTTGFTDLNIPEDAQSLIAPPIATIPNDQGFFTQQLVTGGGGGGTGGGGGGTGGGSGGGTGGGTGGTTAGAIDLLVNQKTEFARDLLRIEINITNRSGSARRVGARMVLDPYVDNWFSGSGPTKAVFLPQTREEIHFEKDYTGAFVPSEWQMFDNEDTPTFVAKGYLTGNGATTPSRVVFGNMLDIFPFALAKTTYQWTVRPDWELRISDIGLLIYWDPVSIPAGQTRAFVTYAGVGVANHAMSDTYVNSKQPGVLQGQGYVAAVQTPYALPLVNGESDTTNLTATAYLQNEAIFSSPRSFAFIELPDGLQFSSSDTSQTARLDLGTVGAIGTVAGSDEGSGSWQLQATGIEAGYLPIVVTFGNSFQDTARVTRLVNVPQGRKYQLANEWRMITFPFTYGNLQDDPTVALGLPSGSFQIVRYNAVTNSYDQVDRIQPGLSYWVRLTTLNPGQTSFVHLNNALPVRLGKTDPTGSTDLFTVQVQTGWNQVGNPSPYAVRLRDLQFFTFGQLGGQLIPFDQAVSLGWFRPGLFSYNIKTGLYEQLTADSVIQPGQGIWIFSSSERFIAWPAPTGPGLSIR